MGEILIRTIDLSKEFRDKKAVDKVSLNIPAGSIYGLIGRNGAGKTTFMRMICGMTEPTSGEIVCKGEGRPDYGKIGALIELPALNPKLSAFANLKLNAWPTTSLIRNTSWKNWNLSDCLWYATRRSKSIRSECARDSA